MFSGAPRPVPTESPVPNDNTSDLCGKKETDKIKHYFTNEVLDH